MNRLTKTATALLVAGLVGGGAMSYWIFRHATVSLSETYERLPDYSSQIVKEDVYLTAAKLRRLNGRLAFKPRSDLAAHPMATPLDWSMNPFKDVNWQFQLHAWRMMDPLLNEYFKSGSQQSLHEAFSYALDWFSYHYERKLRATMAWYDMAAGIRAMKLALFVDRYHAGELKLRAEEAQRLMTLVDEHATRLQDGGFIADNNHGLFQVFGLNLLCTVAADREPCAHGREFAEQRFSQLLEHQFTAEGVHREHSPSYHFFVSRIINDLGGAKRFDDPKLTAILEKTAAVEAWLLDPSGKEVAIGDSGSKASRPSQQPESPVVGDFSRSGYAIVRGKGSMLFVTGMANSLTHKHADDLSFVLFEHGRPLFIDSGKYGYANDPMRRYVESAAAHNTISLLNDEIGPSDITMSGSSLKSVATDEEGFSITGKIKRPGLFEQERKIRYVPGTSIVIHDEISSSSKQEFVSSLHLAGDLQPERVEDGFDVSLPDGKTIRARLDPGSGNAPCRIEIARGQNDPVLGWETVDYLKMKPASVARAICPGQTRSITWNIALQ